MQHSPGARFGRLTIIEQAESAGGRRQWLCRCSCGSEKIISSKHLGRETLSCGCLAAENAAARCANRALNFDERLKRMPSGCLEWQGARDRSGYGTLRAGKRDHKAHRLAYERAFGPITNGRFVCHTCDNPPCCEPSHLFLGTSQDNIDDRQSKGRGASGERMAAAKVNDHAVRQIRRLVSEDGHTQQAVAEMFGIDQTTVSKIVLRVSWKHVK
jgi:hypothetical protein